MRPCFLALKIALLALALAAPGAEATPLAIVRTPERAAAIQRVIARYEDLRARVSYHWPEFGEALPCARARRVGFVRKVAGLEDSVAHAVTPAERRAFVELEIPISFSCSVRGPRATCMVVGGDARAPARAAARHKLARAAVLRRRRRAVGQPPPPPPLLRPPPPLA